MALEQWHPHLVERGSELSFLEARLAAVHRSRTGTVLALESPAGVGKTALLTELVKGASSRGFLVLRARGGELERDLGWGVVRELFYGRLRQLSAAERERVLAGAAHHAAPIFGLARDAALSGAQPDRPAAVLNGLYWTLAGLADAAPVLVCVDDAHWADAPSLRFCAYVAKRVEELPVLLAIAYRPVSSDGSIDDGSSVGRLLEGVASVAKVRRLSPLSAAATGEIVRDALGEAAEDEFCQVCHTVTGGNPFLLRELLASLAADGVEPTAANARLVSEIRPEQVVRSVLGRLAQLPEPAVRLVRAAAVLGTRARLAHTGELAGLSGEQLERAFEGLVGADILTDDPEPSFVHPLVREVIYQETSAAARLRLHAAAAGCLIGRGAPLPDIASQVVSAAAREVEEAASILLAAAQEALARGAAETAVRYARRALDEAPGHAIRVEILRALGRAELALGNREGVSTLSTAFDASDDREARREIALEVSEAARPLRQNPDAIRLLDRSLGEAEPQSQSVERLQAELISHQMMDPSTLDRAVGQLLGFRRVHEQVRDPVLLATVALSLSVGAKDRAAAIDCASRAVAAKTPDDPSPSAISPAAQALAACDDLAAAHEALTLLVERGVSLGSAALFAFGSCYRSRIACQLGHLLEAESDARAAIDVFAEHGIRRPEARAFLLDILIDRGDLDGGQEQADALAESESEMQVWDRAWSALALARLRIARGQLGEVLELLYRGGEHVERATGMRNVLPAPWRVEAAIVHAQLGQRVEALSLLEPALERALSFGAPRGIGITYRAKGLTVGGAEGIALLEKAAENLAASAALLDHARGLVDLGAALRRGGRRSDARDRLREGLDLASRCGAGPLADRARAELVAAGARPRRDALRGRDALTASEFRVAEKAASGMTNRAIAQALFVSERTVETHLTHAYQKLDISSRGQLSRRLGERAA